MKINKKGFTLVELLVVVLIIGILATIAVPQYQIAIAKSRLSAIKNIVTSIKNANEIYYLSNGKYSTTFDNLDISLPEKPTIDDNGWYVFTWGTCGGSQKSISCVIPGWFSLQKYYSNSDEPNASTCLAVADNITANKVCQMDTGSKTPRWTGNSIGYRWNTYKYIK